MSQIPSNQGAPQASNFAVQGALPLIGSPSRENGQSVLNSIDSTLAKLFEDRNILLAEGGTISWSTSSNNLTFSAALKLHVNSKIAGGSPVVIDLTNTTRAFSADDRMLYATIDRGAGTAVVTADATTLPSVVAANVEVVLLAKRINGEIYFRNGFRLASGQSAALGRTGSVVDTEFVINDSADPTKQIAFDAAGTTGTKTTIATSTSANRIVTLPDASDTLVGRGTVDTLNNKTLQFLRQAVITDSSTTGSNATVTPSGTGIVRLTNASLVSLSGIAAGVSGQQITLENLTGTAITINNDDAGASAANRIYTGSGGSATLKNQGTFVFTYDATSLRWMLTGGSGSGSGSGGLNFLVGGDAESGTTGYVAYKDAAASRPVDGVGGSPTLVSIATSSTAPLSGLNSFIITKTGGSSAQGEGIGIDFTIDSARKAKVLQIDMDYIVNSGTFAAGTSSADSDLIVYLYDVTNAKLIEPSSFKLLSNSSTISDRFSSTFQTSPDSTSYRLILHVATASTSAWSLKVDSITVSPSVYVFGTPITDWVPTTFTGSWTSNTTYSGFSRRVGDSKEYQVRLNLTGAPNAANLTITIPDTIDTNKVANFSTTGVVFGQGSSRDDSAGAGYKFYTVYNSSNSVLMVYQSSTSAIGTAVSNTTPFVYAVADTVTAWFTVPILGLSSSVQMSDRTDTRVVAATYSGTPTGTLNASLNTTTLPTNNGDTHGAYVGGVYTVPVTGFYEIEACTVVTGTITVGSSFTSMAITLNGTSRFGSNKYADVNTEIETQASGVIFANAGQTIELKMSVNSITSPSYVSTFRNHFSIKRTSGPSAIAATETIALRYSSSAGGSIPIGGAVQSFATKNFDTHNAWNGTTFTAPAPGIYEIGAMITTAPVTLTTSQVVQTRVLKNAVDVATLDRPFGNGVSNNYVAKGVTRIQLVAGDTIQILANCSANTSQEPAVTFNYVDIARVR